jgi:hypothetical protein
MARTIPEFLRKVEHELVRLGMTPVDAKAAVDDEYDWFADHAEAGAFPELTAQDWFNHQAD